MEVMKSNISGEKTQYNNLYLKIIGTADII